MIKNNLPILVGAVITVMAGWLMFSLVKNIKINTGEITQQATKIEIADDIYEIKKGDSLWKIALLKYGDGFRWTDIYEANKFRKDETKPGLSVLHNPDNLEVGMKIIIPTKGTVNKIHSYTVLSGDNLWQIAKQQCGNGFLWNKIASDNNLAKPNLIHKGNVLNIQCQPEYPNVTKLNAAGSPGR